MKTIDRHDIASYIGKDSQTVSGWKSKQPKLLELVRLGMLCIKNDIDEERLTKLVELQEMMKSAAK